MQELNPYANELKIDPYLIGKTTGRLSHKVLNPKDAADHKDVVWERKSRNMRKQKWTRYIGTGSWIKMVVVAGVALVLVKMFSPESQPPVDHPITPEDCQASVFVDGKNLRILEGSRSPANILHDLAPIICGGQKVFDRMKAGGESIAAGMVTLRMAVEYNGEIVSSEVQESGIKSQKFLTELSTLIAMTDFTFWNREDVDTVFIYTARFGH